MNWRTWGKGAWGILLVVLWVLLLVTAAAADDSTDRIVAAILLVGLGLDAGVREHNRRFERYAERQQERHDALLATLRDVMNKRT